jgi:large subunit ribosomal protein L22
MSKPKTKRALKSNEAKAVTRSIRVNTRKLNEVAASIRGKKVATALAMLTFSQRRIAKDVKKTLESAIANAENNHDLDINNLIVAEAWTGKNLVMKRWFPDARGRVGHIEKFFSELTIVVREVREPSKEAA